VCVCVCVCVQGKPEGGAMKYVWLQHTICKMGEEDELVYCNVQHTIPSSSPIPSTTAFQIRVLLSCPFVRHP
jgi:hypothetical protein